MLFPIIKVKDGDHIHIVGTNSHDQLYVDEETGGIQYLNLQCCEGTKKFGNDDEDDEDDEVGKSSMEFVAERVEWEPYPLIEMVTIEELIKIAIENMINQTKKSIALHEAAKRYFETKEVCDKRRKGDDSGVTDSSGMLF